MTTALDTEIALAVAEVLAEVGVTMTVRTRANEVINTQESTVTDDTPDEHTITTSPIIDYDDKFVDNEIILAGDSYIIIGGSPPFDPETLSEVIFQSVTWTIMRIKKHYSGDLVGAYELHLRK